MCGVIAEPTVEVCLVVKRRLSSDYAHLSCCVGESQLAVHVWHN